jgi:hypothetical protein
VPHRELIRYVFTYFYTVILPASRLCIASRRA